MKVSSPDLVRDAAHQLRARLQSLPCADDERTWLQVQSGLDDCLSKLAASRMWGAENRLLSSMLWNIAGDLLETGWLQARARFKPRGYAGDHELLARIVERRICEHPLGRHFDRYFQEQAAPQAVRNRLQMSAEWIVESALARQGNCRLAVVGAGPGIDVALACERLPAGLRRGLQVTLLDIDDEALASASHRLAPLLLPGQITQVRDNLFRLAQRPKLAAHLQATDLLLCTGLFDYLDDESAVSMLREFFRQLAPGGTARVFNFTPHNPTRAYMEWIGNWYLIYRTRDDLKSLAAGAGVPPERCELGAEPLGIDLYLSASK